MSDEKKNGLKSAFDLAMERMAQKGGQLVALSDEQKKAIADVAQKAKAKIAETEIMFRQTLAKAREAGDEKKLKEAEQQLTDAIAKLRAREEAEKDRIRTGG